MTARPDSARADERVRQRRYGYAGASLTLALSWLALAAPWSARAAAVPAVELSTAALLAVVGSIVLGAVLAGACLLAFASRRVAAHGYAGAGFVVQFAAGLGAFAASAADAMELAALFGALSLTALPVALLALAWRDGPASQPPGRGDRLIHLFVATVPLLAGVIVAQGAGHVPGPALVTISFVLSAVLTALALYFTLAAARWRSDPFEHSLVLVLMLSTFASLAFVAGQTGQGALLAMFSLMAGVVGIFMSVHQLFARLAKATAAAKEAEARLHVEVARRQQTELALEAEVASLENLIESAPEGIVVLDEADRVLKANPQFLRMFGYGADEVVGRTTAELVGAPGRESEADELSRRVQAGEHVAIETVRRRRDGSLIDVSILGTPYPAGSTSHCIFGIYREIGEQKRLEAELRAAHHAAQEASIEKSRFLATMSHELRTPLNSVIGFTNVLLKNRAGNLLELDLKYLDRILTNGRHLLTLINEVLDLSKCESGRMELDIEEVDLAALVRQTVQQLEGRTVGRDVELREHVPALLAPLQADPLKLRQVLINLIGNALKFTESGTVVVSVVHDPATHEPLRVDVVDSGVGIPADRIDAIFSPFVQADSDTGRRFGGTGLGLSISRSLSELMGFRIAVASEVGSGSTFSLVLSERAPQLRHEPIGGIRPALRVADGGVDSNAGRERQLVLVIDDSEDARTLLAGQIADFGYNVVTAESAAEAFDLMRGFRPDAITLDLNMPNGMNGVEFLNSIRARPEYADIPVVVVSVSATDARSQIGGASAALDKPVSSDDLARILERSLSGHADARLGPLLRRVVRPLPAGVRNERVIRTA